jgi:hypothetical protein
LSDIDGIWIGKLTFKYFFKEFDLKLLDNKKIRNLSKEDGPPPSTLGT